MIRERVIGYRPPTWRTRGCSSSGLYPSTNPAWLDLPGAKAPAGTALRVIDTLGRLWHEQIFTNLVNASWNAIITNFYRQIRKHETVSSSKVAEKKPSKFISDKHLWHFSLFGRGSANETSLLQQSLVEDRRILDSLVIEFIASLCFSNRATINNILCCISSVAIHDQFTTNIQVFT